MKSGSASRFIGAVIIAVGALAPAAAIDIQRPTVTVNVPKPTINVPRPTINVPRPTINVPRSAVTVNVPKPAVNVPKPVVEVPKPHPVAVLPKPVIAVPKAVVETPKIKPNPVAGLPKPSPINGNPKIGITTPALAGDSKPVLNPSLGGVPKPVAERPLPPGVTPKSGLATSGAVDGVSNGSPTSSALPTNSPGSGKTGVAAATSDVKAIGGGGIAPVGGAPSGKASGTSSAQPMLKGGAVAKAASGGATPNLEGSTSAPAHSEFTCNVPPCSMPASSTASPIRNATGSSSMQPMSASSGATAMEGGIAPRPTTGSPTNNSSGSSTAGSNATITRTVNGPNGTFGTATVNSNGTVTVSNNLGSVTLTPQQMQQVARGDMSPLAALMGTAPSTPMGPARPTTGSGNCLPACSWTANDPIFSGRNGAAGSAGSFSPNEFAPTLLQRAAMALPDIPDSVANAVAGFGDRVSKGLTFGLWSTADYRKSQGLENYVNTDSAEYRGGETAGKGLEIAMAVAGGVQAGKAVIGGVGNLIRGAEAASTVGETAGGIVEATEIANPVPKTLARVIPGEGPYPTLGSPANADVFVTDARAIEGLTPAQISQKLSIPASDTFTVVKFETPAGGLASPINRTNPGFIGGGRTAGGAPEFVVPNGPVPPTATVDVVRSVTK
jgi:hypothetical protein